MSSPKNRYIVRRYPSARPRPDGRSHVGKALGLSIDGSLIFDRCIDVGGASRIGRIAVGERAGITRTGQRYWIVEIEGKGGSPPEIVELAMLVLDDFKPTGNHFTGLSPLPRMRVLPAASGRFFM
ncbi:hypothetical protein [Rhizobium sp. NZLR1]|uniref:hypothetical protein n=1 Tax=Rhizobium sp. NZLR1 TaxID=2731096 RepID=UPI001A97FA1B|nr:hypothetical protein [Rhizobium sp. NZLR1]MBX5203231.1 hypothetical protein [Rhizobium sp. NZLR1]QSZ23298.1 hypothetical protein J3O30_14775 [Rhizobium sp. NZLR1]